jgi:Tfp pilus assembly protein PilN
MRIGINLASRPYQDEGRFYRLWGTALALTILLTAVILGISVRHYQNSRKEWVSARQAEARLASLKQEAAQAAQILARPENRGTRDRSQFLNTAILQKSFSWTRLLEDMEKVMPPGLRVTSIAPVTDQHNHFVLRVHVQGETRDGAVQLLRNMEKSQHFRSPQLSSESHGEYRGVEGGVISEIVTSYLPAETLEGGG